MKYGLVYSKDTSNIGDDILTYAGKQFLPKVDYLIDRENMDIFLPIEKEEVSVIINGWFLHNFDHFPPSPYITPLYVGIHFTEDEIMGGYEYLKGYTSECLKRNQPIGCRDKRTANILSSQGIESCYSGCLTLTLKPFDNVKASNKVIFVDVEQEIMDYVKQVLPKETLYDYKTHKLSQGERGIPDWSYRERRLESYLKEYQAADLVITTRLHCALPCVALGTPVVLLGRYDEDFYGRVIDLAEYCSICLHRDDLLSGQYNDFLTNPRENNTPYQMIEALKNKCVDFVNREISHKSLPDIELYKEIYISRSEYLRNVINRLRNEKIMFEYKIEKLLSAK